MKFIPIRKINFGQNDATNYTDSFQKQFFNQVFLQDDKLNELKKPNKYFLVGDKGTGKTAYSVFMQNNPADEYTSVVKTIDATDYERFIKLKNMNHLSLSDYTDVWKLIILLIVAEQVRKDSNISTAMTRFTRMSTISRFIDEFYRTAFTPEIPVAIKVVEEIQLSTAAMLKLFEQSAGGNSTSKRILEIQTTDFQSNIQYLIKQFIDALFEIKYKKDFVVFIDGIDIRPNAISYKEYLECVRGLCNAVWHLNSEIFQVSKATRKIRTVLLIRPDILDEIGLQNLNSKIIDNSVTLNWITHYDSYSESSLFRMADRLLRKQQENSDELQLGESWNHYFPYTIINNTTGEQTDSAFIDFLRFSFHRPRDIIMLLTIIQKYCPATAKNTSEFPPVNMQNSKVQRDYSKYLVGEIKDSLFFYQDYKDFETFKNFFRHLKPYVNINKREFSYDNFIIAFDAFVNYCTNHDINICSPIYEGAEKFLQTLFELNIISYLEDSNDADLLPRQFWHFRLRSDVDVRPCVRYDCNYRFHKGLATAFNIT
jgi:hypothetical protein